MVKMYTDSFQQQQHKNSNNKSWRGLRQTFRGLLITKTNSPQFLSVDEMGNSNG